MNEWTASLQSEYDRYLFHEGSHYSSYQMLGAHLQTVDGTSGVRFSVWAPRAEFVQVVGDFNHWTGDDHGMERIGESGLWHLFVAGLEEGTVYKYRIGGADGVTRLKCDPYAFWAEVRPNTGSVVYDIRGYDWNDQAWMESKKDYNSYANPLLIYEANLGSWKQKGFEKHYSYRELAEDLVNYAADMGYTHLELMPIVEHPFDGSWGYQATGYFAPTSRYGTPKDFMYFVDCAHARGLGVILDWVPGHFCKDDPGLRWFDGSPTYEYADPLLQESPSWGTANFDLGRPEVRSFLLSNACYWMREYHVDGLRVDAVANMLYLNYDRPMHERRKNKYGGPENLEAVDFLRRLHQVVFDQFDHPLMMAEESTEWPLVSHPTYLGGLGFNYKWNMGWMNDILKYMKLDPVHRKHYHHLLTFSFMYAFSENFVLPLSHDEVVHGKQSLLDKMPGDYWQKFANLRLLFAYMMAHPGKKLLFMGGEYGQFIEWKYRESLDWHLLEYPMHAKMKRYVHTLNHLYRSSPSLWSSEKSDGFAWIDPHDNEQSVVSFLRQTPDGQEFTVIVCSFTPVVRYDYRIGVPALGTYTEVFNSDAEAFGGSGQTHAAELAAEEVPWHSQPYSLQLKLPPLGAVYLQCKTAAGTSDAPQGEDSDNGKG